MAAASDEVNRKIGVSSGVLQKFKPAEARGDNVTISYKITPDMRAQLLTLYPDLKRQHEATVPHQITESEFCTATSTSSADRLSRTSQSDVTPPTHAVCYALLSDHSHRMLIGACNPTAYPVRVFRATRGRVEEALPCVLVLPAL